MQLAYLLHGSEPLLLEDAWRELRDSLSKSIDFELDFLRFRAGQHDISEVLSALDSFPFVSQYRLVLLEEGQKLSSDDQKKIVRYVEEPSQSHIFVILAAALTARSPLLAAAKKAGVVRELSPPTRPGEIAAFARKELKRLAIEADDSAIALIVEWTEGDLLRLRQEVEKLAIFSDGKRLSAQHVRDTVARNTETSIFSFTDSVGAQDLPGALTLLRRLLAGGEPPLKILAMMMRQIRQLVMVRELMDGGRAAQIEATLKVPPFVGSKLRKQAHSYSAAALASAFEVIIDTDKKIKSGRMAPDFALEDALYRMLRPEWV